MGIGIAQFVAVGLAAVLLGADFKQQLGIALALWALIPFVPGHWQ